mgnify:FL=1
MSDPHRTRSRGRPLAVVSSSAISLDRVAEMRTTNPPAPWNAIGAEMGVTGEAVRKLWLRWGAMWRSRQAPQDVRAT